MPATAPLATLLLLLGLLTACSTDNQPAAEPSGPTSSSTSSSTASPAPTAAPGTKPDLPPVAHRESLPRLMRQAPRAGRLRVVERELTNGDYTRWRVTYRSDGATVSGVLLRPRGRGPFPAVVLAHGYIDPEVYVTGQGLAREQDWLARSGFVVLHTDYRGHAASDPLPALARETRLTYTRDVVNAVAAVKRAPYVDAERTALLGRSMGGGIVLNALVTRPGLVDAAVVYASVSSRYLDNLRHFTVPSRPDAVRALHERHGTPREQPRFYRDLSSRTFFDRVTEPVLMHHGTADETCPFRWATTTQRLLRGAGVDSRLAVYRGEHHSFVPQWQDSIERSVRFLRQRLRP